MVKYSFTKRLTAIILGAGLALSSTPIKAERLQEGIIPQEYSDDLTAIIDFYGDGKRFHITNFTNEGKDPLLQDPTLEDQIRDHKFEYGAFEGFGGISIPNPTSRSLDQNGNFVYPVRVDGNSQNPWQFLEVNSKKRTITRVVPNLGTQTRYTISNGLMYDTTSNNFGTEEPNGEFVLSPVLPSTIDHQRHLGCLFNIAPRNIVKLIKKQGETIDTGRITTQVNSDCNLDNEYESKLAELVVEDIVYRSKKNGRKEIVATPYPLKINQKPTQVINNPPRVSITPPGQDKPSEDTWYRQWAPYLALGAGVIGGVIAAVIIPTTDDNPTKKEIKPKNHDYIDGFERK